MGSLIDGQPINKDYNRRSIKHQGAYLKRTNSLSDIETTVPNSGTLSSGNYYSTGVVWAASSTVKNENLSITERNADNSINRSLFTTDATASGDLKHNVTRKINGIQVSVSKRQTVNSLGPMRTVTERKVFFTPQDRNQSTPVSDWNIFNASGVPVGAGAGTTDTDITPSGVGTN